MAIHESDQHIVQEREYELNQYLPVAGTKYLSYGYFLQTLLDKISGHRQ